MDEMLRKSFSAQISQSEEGEDLYTCIASSEIMDQDFEVVLVAGMDCSRFNKSGAIYHQHDYDKLIGSPVKTWKDADNLYIQFKMLKRPEGSENNARWDEIEFYQDLVRIGAIKGVSIGYQEYERRRPTAKDVAKYGQLVQNVVSKSVLLELSVTGIQCNDEALIIGVQQGKIALASVKSFLGKELEIPEVKEPEVETEVKSVEPEVETPLPKVVVALTAQPQKEITPAPKKILMTLNKVEKTRAEEDRIKLIVARKMGRLYY